MPTGFSGAVALALDHAREMRVSVPRDLRPERVRGLSGTTLGVCTAPGTLRANGEQV